MLNFLGEFLAAQSEPRDLIRRLLTSSGQHLGLVVVEIFPKAVDGRDRSSGLFFDSVYELNVVNHVAEQAGAVEFSPSFLGLLGQLEHHRQAGFA
jgi:hypothetical protein